MKSNKKISYSYYLAKMKSIAQFSYDYFLANRHRFVKPALFWILLMSVVIGAGYRGVVLKEKFRYTNEAIAGHVSLASNLRKAPGKYSFEEFQFILKNPEEYTYTIGKSKFKPNAPQNGEIGWGFILHLILKDGIKGMDNIALYIVRYQLMVELAVIILLFWIGKRIAGPLGACLAPLLYSIFKIPMGLMSEPYYYYWTIPFSALSLFFWTIVYRPEYNKNRIPWKYVHFFIYHLFNNKTRIQWKYVHFFIYGILIGFATVVRLYFLFLPLFFAPFLFIREKSLKRGIILLLIIFLGQSVFLAPQVLINKKNHGEYTIKVRGHWHLFLQGVGLYKNPWGIPDSGEVNLNKWAIARGAPDMFKDLEASEKWYKTQYFKMVKEHPEVFIRTFLKHLKLGLTVSTTEFQFFGIIDNHSPGMYRFMALFPWMLLSAFLLLFIVNRNQFWMGLAVVLQGLYLLLVVVTWFGNYPNFIASYIPAFILFLALAVAVHVKVLIAIIEGSLRCWIYNKGIRTLPKEVSNCYHKDWNVDYRSTMKQPNGEPKHILSADLPPHS